MYINKAKKIINVLFLETSEYFLGSVGRHFFFILRLFFTLEKHEIIQNTLKIERKKNLKCLKKFFMVGPKKVCSVWFPETRHFFLPNNHLYINTFSYG